MRKRKDPVNIECLVDDVFGQLSRRAEETARLAELASIVSEIQANGKRWTDASNVTLVLTAVYAIRRVGYAGKARRRIKFSERPMLARWTTNGWRDEIGFLKAADAQFDGIQVWV